MMRLKYLMLIVIVFVTSSCEENILDKDPTFEDIVYEELVNMPYPRNIDVFIEESNYIIYHFETDELVCEAELEYLFKDILFYHHAGCTNAFVTFGYFGYYDEMYLTLEEMVELRVINELEIASFIPVVESDSDIDEVEHIDNYEELDGLYFKYLYHEDSIYHTSIKHKVVDFLQNPAVRGYQDVIYYSQYLKLQHIPILEIRGSDYKYMLVGGEIVDFIDEVTGMNNSQIEQYVYDMYGNFDYERRHGRIDEYDIIHTYHDQGPTMWVETRFEYMGYHFWDGSLHRDGDRLANIGFRALKDGRLYEIESLVDQGELHIDDFVRLIAIYDENPKEW